MKYLLLILLYLPLTIQAELLQGKVVRVTDGDTITILDNANNQHRIRLSGIDAPERKQAFGEKSREALATLVAGKQVEIDWNKRDKYRRIVGKVLVDGQDVNLEQIQRGMAWHYKKYENEQDVEDRSTYANAEYEAQRDKLGLWSDKQAVAPWEFRALKRVSSAK